MSALRTCISKAVLSDRIDAVQNELAVAGVDLIVSSVTGRPYIVELNNNPAIPSESKEMSTEYKKHLHDFMSRLINLSCCDNNSSSVECAQFFIPVMLKPNR
jgi:hypothetical protein